MTFTLQFHLKYLLLFVHSFSSAQISHYRFVMTISVRVVTYIHK